MQLLARRDFASAGVARAAAEQAIDDVTAATVIAELTREGVLDDARYAQNYVAYHAGRGQGPLRIAAQLRRHGLAPGSSRPPWAAGRLGRARPQGAQRAGSGGSRRRAGREKARQARFLQYRGFSSDHIRAATGADPDAD